MVPPPAPSPQDSDLRLAFDMAPVGLLVSRHRVVPSYNPAFSQMFGYAPEALVGRSLEQLYPSGSEYEHIGGRAAHAQVRRLGHGRTDRAAHGTALRDSLQKT